jgi:hypothetical protein
MPFPLTMYEREDEDRHAYSDVYTGPKGTEVMLRRVRQARPQKHLTYRLGRKLPTKPIHRLLMIPLF